MKLTRAHVVLVCVCLSVCAKAQVCHWGTDELMGF